MIDSHCHLNFDRFADDRARVLQRAARAGVHAFIVPAVDLASCDEVLALARRHPNIHAAVGVHPNSCAHFGPESLRKLARLSHSPAVVAIGEIGLDYYREFCPPDQQRHALRHQLSLAAERSLPVIIHNRDAAADLLPLLTAHARAVPPALTGRVGVLHSFSASAAVAAQAPPNSATSSASPAPSPSARPTHCASSPAISPLDRLLVETDAPFLAPEPLRGKRNEPAFLPHIVARLAALHDLSAPEMARVTADNAAASFNSRLDLLALC